MLNVHQQLQTNLDVIVTPYNGQNSNASNNYGFTYTMIGQWTL